MNLEVEAAGASASAGLAAHEIDGIPDAPAASPIRQCANCGTEVLLKYCPACGQPVHIHDSLLHLGEEVLHGILHFDAKGWRTLPMLVLHPGQLTRSYIDGQRTRYVSPLALFLFMVFVMFFVISLTANINETISTKEGRAKARITKQLALDEKKAELARLQAALIRTPSDGAATRLAAARSEQQTAQAQLESFDADTLQRFPVKGSPEAAKQLNLNEMLAGNPLLQRFPSLAHLKNAGDNPDLTLYKLKNTAYKFSFLLVPISLPFMWLLFFRRRDATMYGHAVFALYSISFMSLLFVAMALIDYFGLGKASLLLFLLAPLHMFRQLRGTYALGKWSTLWRTAVLMAVAGMVFLLYLLLILLLTVL